jgi:hypothetical protein
MSEKILLTIKFYYSPMNAQVIVLKTTLKFTLNSSNVCVCVCVCRAVPE